jgi:hypothetical protein
MPRFISGSPDEASLWVWKSIESSGRLGALARAFPRAKMLFIIRHPCGVTASVLKGEAGAKFSAGSASEDYGFFEMLAQTESARQRNLTLEAFRSMSATQRVAWRWALLNEKVMNDMAGLDRCHVLRYEELCAEPAAVAKSLFRFVGLPWDSQTERFIRESTGHERSDYYSVFKNPMTSANRWRRELPSEVVEAVMNTVRNTAPGRLYADT